MYKSPHEHTGKTMEAVNFYLLRDYSVNGTYPERNRRRAMNTARDFVNFRNKYPALYDLRMKYPK